MGMDIAAYDYCSFILLLIVVIYYFRTSVHGTYRVRIMTAIVALTMCAAICDATRVRFASIDAISDLRFINVTFAYMVLLLLISPLYLLYVIATTDTWHKLSRQKLAMVLYTVPLIAYFILLLFNFFRPVAFETGYAEGTGKILIKHWGYYCGYVLFLLYVAVTAIYVRKYLKPADPKRYRVLISPLIIVALGVIINMILPEHHIICFLISLCILILVLINRRVEDSVDLITSMHTYKVFADDMDINFKTGKRMELILINIINYNYALRMVGYDDMLKMMSPVSSEILRIMKKHHAQFMCYYNGNGKFAIELSEKHSSYAGEIAAEIGHSIRQNISMEVADFELEINTCIVKCPEDISDVDSLFMLITDLDLVKENGRVVSASSITGTEEFALKKEMSSIIDRAFANHYFSVFYQPIFDTNSKRFASAEALIRLNDPKYGQISPALFIPLAERSGAIHAIGSFVLEEVVKFIASEEFEELGVDFIEINLSAMQCLRSDLADEIISLCRRYKVPPSKINLEITETASAYSQSKLYGNITKLSENGFRFSLDDFGTGYSNLMRIASLPLEIVKLDRVFVQMEESGGHHVIITNLIKMLKDMKKKVLVEGVETAEMAEAFIGMGVDEIQGFYYSKPIGKSAYIGFVKDKAAI